MASVWKLPVVFVVEDNDWAISVPRDVSTCIPSNADRAAAYGIPGVVVDGNDVLAVYEVAEAAVKSGKPAIVHLKIDPEAVTPTMSLTAIREKALAGKGA